MKILTYLANTLKFFVVTVIASKEEGTINSYKTCHYLISDYFELKVYGSSIYKIPGA